MLDILGRHRIPGYSEATEKDCFGEMLSWNMLAAGILPQNLDNRCLKFFGAMGGEQLIINGMI